MSTSASTFVTNKPLNVDERRALENVAKQEREIVATLNAQITESSATVVQAEATFIEAQIKLMNARAMLELLMAQRDRVERSLKENGRVLHPLRKLSSKLLTEIFWHCAEKHSIVTGSKPISICLSQVCRKWRITAHSTPYLWRFIDIHFVKHKEPGTRTKHWIERSGDLPLSLSLYSITTASSKSHVDEVMDILLRETSRWASLFLGCEEDASVLHKLLTPLPKLKQLHLHGTKITTDPVPQGFLPHCPALQSIRLCCFHSPRLPFLSPVLEELELYLSHPPSELLPGLSRIPGLHTLALGTTWDSDQQVPSPSSFPNLTTLVLDHRSVNLLANAEGPLAFPNVQNLTLDYLESTAEMQLLFCFLRHMPHPEVLQKLILKRFDDGRADAERIEELRRSFSRLAGLETLILDTVKSDDRFLGMFAETSDEPPQWLCPNLQRLKLVSCNNISHQAILQLVDARGEAYREASPNRPVHIKSVTVQECKEVNPLQRQLIDERLKHFLQ